jgi:hypothetical protein
MRQLWVVVLVVACASGPERRRPATALRASHAANVAFAGMNLGLNLFEMYASSRGAKRLDATAWTEYRQGVSSQPVPSIPMFQLGSLAAGGTTLGLTKDWRKREFQLVAGGLALAIAGVVTTLAITAPAQSEIDGWDSANPPADWRDYKDRLQRANILRTTFHGLAMALNVAALTIAW